MRLQQRSKWINILVLLGLVCWSKENRAHTACRTVTSVVRGDTGRTLGVLEDVRVSENSAQGVLTEPWCLIHSDTGSPEAYYRCACVCVCWGGLVEEMPSLKAR